MLTLVKPGATGSPTLGRGHDAFPLRERRRHLRRHSAPLPALLARHPRTRFLVDEAFQVARLAKRFGEVTAAVDDVSFEVAQGMPLALDFAALGVFCVTLFVLSVRNIHRRWIR